MSKTIRYRDPRDADCHNAKLAHGRDGAPREICTEARDGKLNSWATWSHGKGKARAKAIATREVRRFEKRQLLAAMTYEL
jgi:hypothetical protein